MIAEFKWYLERFVPKNRELFLNFQKNEDRLDTFFYSKVGDLDCYPQFSRAIKIVVILIHGQAQVERGFNVNDTMLQPNLQGLSLQSQRMIHAHLESNCLTPAPLDITKGLRESVRKARSRQRLDQAAAKEKDL